MLRLFTDYRMGGIPRYYVAEKPEHLMLVPDFIRRNVVFIRYTAKDGTKKFAGTGFFVSIRVESLGISFVYIVTARHILAKIQERGLNQNIYVRLNRRNGTAVDIETNYNQWQYHPDSLRSVDVAVLGLAPSNEEFEYMAIPIDMALTPTIVDEYSIGVGDETFFPGLFTGHHTGKGNGRILPVVRLGNISLMPGEPVKVKDFGYIDAYLMEARSIGGLSGSPVFVHVGAVRAVVGKATQFNEHLFFWLGLVHGHYDVKLNTPDLIDLTEDIEQEEKINMGMAIVVPVADILEVINQPLFEEHRKREIKRREDDNLPTPDFADDEDESEQTFTEEDFEEALRKVTRRDNPPAEKGRGKGRSDKSA